VGGGVGARPRTERSATTARRLRRRVERDLQDVVDRLSARLGRPVLIDDTELRPLAYSRQTGSLDAVRTVSILERGAPPPVRDALFGYGIASAPRAAPVHIAADPSIDMAARICVPIGPPRGRHGYLWVIEDEPLPDADLEATAAAAQRAEELLAAEAAQQAERAERDEALLQDLAAAARAPADLAAELERRRLLQGRPLTVCVTATEPAGGDAHRRWLRAGLDRLRRRMAPGAVLAGELDGRPACIAAASPAALADAGAPSIAEALVAAVEEEPGPDGARAVVGEGEPFADLAAAPAAHRRARAALRAVSHGAARWSDLGADRVLAHVDPRAALADLPPGVARLLEPEHAPLRETLAAYLERAGDVKTTADALSLHRAGLYYRLRRIEELAGVDLRRGDDRLLCHLALRLADRAPRER